MPLTRVGIVGLRGYASPQVLEVAVPTGDAGSGMTVIVGANGAGKTTIVEALQFLQRVDAPPPLPDGKINVKTAGYVAVQYWNEGEGSLILKTADAGGGDPAWQRSNERSFPPVWVIPPRRVLPEGNIQKNEDSREDYLRRVMPGWLRVSSYSNFAARLSAAARQASRFNEVFAKIVDPPPRWYVTDSGRSENMFVVRFVSPTGAHASDGVSEGYASLFWIVDGLYDSKPGDVIVIDEPELSLHPALQRHLAALLADYSRDRQIVVATHSPYFIDWRDIFRGARLARVAADDSGSRIFNLSRETAGALRGQTADVNNPHVLGLDAREVFFLEDGIILTEGSDDVQGYTAIAEQLSMEWGGHFYGWGVGGAQKMGNIARVLAELGFERVFGIVDAGQELELDALKASIPRFRFAVIPAPDVRTKKALKERAAVEGLTDANGKVRPEYSEFIRNLITEVHRFTASPST